MRSQPKAAGKAASKLISERIAELGDWRGDTLARMQASIRGNPSLNMSNIGPQKYHSCPGFHGCATLSACPTSFRTGVPGRRIEERFAGRARTGQGDDDADRFGWGSKNPAFGQMWTELIIPGATQAQGLFRQLGHRNPRRERLAPVGEDREPRLARMSGSRLRGGA